ncbi:helix-turn-helix transcriptional regulator [Parasphingorhabdus sp.]|uniref:helix-turn-helix transcriptional regulator n=1 Tax=Parasphingorhabdus sp. TaxID=2709688 RepID=UPI003D2E303B
MTNKPPKLLSINDFCALTGIGRTKAYQELSSGRLTAVKIGRRTLIPSKAIDAWITNQPSYVSADIMHQSEVS